MKTISVRKAADGDVDAIFNLFIERFPFLSGYPEKAREDVLRRISMPDSVTVVAVIDAEIVGVARGYENGGLYLMNSICTASSLSLVASGRVMLTLLPYFIDTCIAHAKRLELNKAFYATEVGSLAGLVPKLCRMHGYAVQPASHGGESGYWIIREAHR